jgi:hypothetical protein
MRNVFYLFISMTVFFSCDKDEEVAAVLGCTDSSACNYDANATEDNGSCEHAEDGYDCDGDSNMGYICDYNSCVESINTWDYDTVEECQKNCLLDDNSNSIEIIYNIHESLPDSWIDEFYLIMNNLINIIPAFMNNPDNLTIYAWNDAVEDPYAGIQGGAYLSGSADGLILVLEIPEMEFTFNHMHRYSVIAHEYFHVYQMSLNESMRNNDFNIMWLVEGAAASFESIYIQDFYDYNYFIDAQNNISDQVYSSPNLFENYNIMDVNYSSAVFMTLVLVKELVNLGHSEEDAFKMIFQDFMMLSPSNQNWELIFEEKFDISVTSFYEILQSYPLDISQVLPSQSLSIEQIFN